ncbi:MAG: BrnA antitoxin family protein [Zoogloeaceae bacterium]|jgi:uncharacterized protein (DUF4415 family)|nr:BrnA antitoxin family protein [Zoogloeaceae bacterium]
MSTVRHESGNLPSDPARKARLAVALARPKAKSTSPTFRKRVRNSGKRLRGLDATKATEAANHDPAERRYVTEWFKVTGKGYQSRINAVLRAIMLRDVERQRK